MVQMYMYEWNATHNVTWLRRSGVEGCKNVWTAIEYIDRPKISTILTENSKTNTLYRDAYLDHLGFPKICEL